MQRNRDISTSIVSALARFDALCLFCALVCLLFIAIGCDGVGPEPSIVTPQPSPVIPTPSPTVPSAVPVGYSKRWLQKVPCAAPCWEGVTPGQTTIQEALSILKQNPGIVPSSVMTRTFEGDDVGYLTWAWIGSDDGGQAMYDTVEASQKVFEIIPFYEALPNDSDSFTLSEVIEAYGEPTHVIAHPGHGKHGEPVYYWLDLRFARNGMWIAYRGMYPGIPKLEPSMSFNRVTFSPVHDDPMIAIFGVGVPWEGFKDFAFYCREIPESRTPSDCPPKK